MRIEGPGGQQWTVRRRWLPWRSRMLEQPWLGGEAALIALAFLAIEWVLLVLLLPVVLPFRILLSRWVVVAQGKNLDGTEMRCERRAERGGVAALQATVVEEIRSGGVPRSLGEVIITSPPTPSVTSNGVEIAPVTRTPAGATPPVTFEVMVADLTDVPDDEEHADAGWFSGALVVHDAQLTFHPHRYPGAVWAVPSAAAVTLRPAADADGPAVTGQLVAKYRAHDGRQIRIAVAPVLSLALQAALSNTADTGPAVH